jgi:hypothetical protein
MTKGERLLQSIKLKDHFHDNHDRRAYLRTVEVAKRIVDEPELVQRGRAFLERFTRNEPNHRTAYEAWNDLLRLSPEEIAIRLLADNEQGTLLRDSAPVFVVFSREEALRLWASA